MNARQRAQLILNHQEADRPLRDFGGTVVSSITATAYARLRNHLGLPYPVEERISDYMMGVVTPGDDVQRLFDVDFRRVAPLWATPTVIDGIWTDGWGIKRRKSAVYDHYDVVGNPLADAGLGDLDSFPWPDPDDTAVFEGVEQRAKDLFENTDYCIIADLVAPGFIGSGLRMCGYERFLAMTMLDEEFVFGFLDRVLEHHKKVYAHYLDRVGKYVQVVCFNDDYGMQDRMMVLPRVFRRFFSLFSKNCLLSSKTAPMQECSTIAAVPSIRLLKT